MADKKVRSLAERKAAALAAVAELEAKELERNKKELVAKTERVAKLEELITKYSEERRAATARISELREAIGDAGTTDAPAPAEAVDATASVSLDEV